MYINFTPHKANSVNAKALSCANIFEYLEKEERQLQDKESFFKEQNNEETVGFFDQKNINIPKEQVIQNIDENRGKRGVKESNFYMINISPSYLEQRHILKKIDHFLEEKESKEKLKWSDDEKGKTRDLMMRDFMTSYGREVMKAYASNFDREINGKKISENDLMYYGRVETKRSYSIKDKHVIRNKELLKKIDKTKDKNQKEQLQKMLHKDYFTNEIIQEGFAKGGPNYHIHIVVSRHDATNDKQHKISLSPMSKYKAQESKLNNQQNKTIGFNRDQFFQNAEKYFDHMFQFSREYSKSYEGRKHQANTKGHREQTKNIGAKAIQITSNAIKKDLNNYTGFNVSNPIQSIPMQLSQSLGVNIPTHLSIPKNPSDLSLKVAKAAVKIIEKGYGM